jgi:excisionase family DNA binding protein
MFDNHNEIWSVPELMEHLCIGKNTAYELLQSGELKAFRIGKVWKIPRRNVEEYAMKQLGEQTG